MSQKMDADYVKRALCFHGQPMQKIWENERGSNDLHKLGMPLQMDYSVYQARQRYFTFQDRAKRLKLHQFLARKADALYDSELKKYANVADERHLEKVQPFHAILPPYELIAHNPNDKVSLRWHAVLESLNPGEAIYCIVTKILSNNTITVKPLCTAEPTIRYLNHLQIKATIAHHDIGPLPTETDGKIRGYYVNDFICCEVLRVLADVDRIILSMNETPKNPNIKYGLISREKLPLYYIKANENAMKHYEECLKETRETKNPNYDVLFSINGLDVNDNFTLMTSLKVPIPEEELAKNLRKAQAGKWAFRAVAEGIERFKKGMHMEAFQCLNKALSIDPENVEGLVARGALFANRGSFQKAIDDFKTAIGINKYHGNARKYLGETLVALGHSLEDDKQYQEAKKAYMDCLQIIPQHPQASECLERLNQHINANKSSGGLLENDILQQILTLTSEPSTSNGNNQIKLNKAESSSSEDSSSDSEDSDSAELEKPNNNNNMEKEPSLSPLSKRMVLHAASLQAAAAPKPLDPQSIRYDQPFYYNLAQSTSAANSNDFKLDDDDTELRVRQLIEQASQHKKAKKKKSKKKKSKKPKKTNGNRDNFDIGNLSGSLFQNNYLQEAFKSVGSNNLQQKLDMDISSYEQKIAEIKERQAKLLGVPSYDAIMRQPQTTQPIVIENSSSPPPPPPPAMTLALDKPIPNLYHQTVDLGGKPEMIRRNSIYVPPAAALAAASAAASASAAPSGSSSQQSPNRDVLSFQIRKPLKRDIFGMLRIATPLAQHHSRSKSRTPSRRGRSRSKSRRSDRDRDRRYSRRSRSRSRSRSASRYRRKRNRSRSRSRSRGKGRRRGRSRSHSKTRSGRRSRSPSPPRSTRKGRKRGNRGGYRGTKFRNNVWTRLGNQSTNLPPVSTITKPTPSKIDEGPTIEEIDEIINKAQKDRKAEIIKRDKSILKNKSGGPL